MSDVLDHGVAHLGVDVIEAISENHLGRGGRASAVLERIRRECNLVLHGVSLSIGSIDPLNLHYLQLLKALVARFEPILVSDHLCFGHLQGTYGHDLWPLPHTEEAVAHVARRVGQVQDFLGRRLYLENPSSYIAFAHAEMSEVEFVREVATRADCGLLLDVNNVYVNARNHGFSAETYLDQLPWDRVGQIHVSGHLDNSIWILDDHGKEVCQEVWLLYQRAIRLIGKETLTILERDDNVPSLVEVARESLLARHYAQSVLT